MDEQEILKERFKSAVSSTVKAISENFDIEIKLGNHTSSIENSINIDYFSDDYSENVEKLDKNIPIVLYCRSGKRSSKSANKLSKLGFKEIYNLQGGILDWIEIGNSVIFNDTIN